MPDGMLPNPWRIFLQELDAELAKLELEERIALHCFGGFVVTTRYNLERRTNDLDILAVHPKRFLAPLIRSAPDARSA